MNKPLFSIIGFLVFSIGLLSVIFSMVGLRFTFLSWMYNHGVATLIIQILLLFGGIVIWYVARTSEPPLEDDI
jgi:hypothetical protein